MTKYLIVRKDNRCFVSDFLKSDGEYLGERLLHFKIFIDKGENKYSPLTIKSANGDYIDDYFRTRYCENVNIDRSPVYKDDKGVYSAVLLEDYDGERIGVSDFSIVEPVKSLLNGVTLTQLKPHGYQMMGYIIDTVHKKTVVIDGGDYVDGDALEDELIKRGGYVDLWFITHYHCDHIGAIMKVLENGKVKFGKMYFNFPSESELKAADPQNADYVKKFLSLLKDNSNVFTTKRGDVAIIDGLTVKTLNDPYCLPRDNFANDSGVVFKVETGGANVLFTGDIGDKRGDELLRDEYFKREISDCVVVQMSHHGNWGVNEAFYGATAVKYCLYPTPLWLWNNDRGQGKHTSFWTTLQTREWMRDKNVLISYTSVCNENNVIK